MVSTEYIYRVLIYVHIIAGGVSLLAGLMPLFVRKGSNVHRFSGRIYFLSMLLVCISAVGSSLFRENLFLLLLAFFTLFQLLSGYRAANSAWRCRIFPGIILLLTGLITGLLMAVSGSAVLLIFGIFCLFMTVRQFLFERKLWKKELPEAGLTAGLHVSGMIGSLISAITAFLVNTGMAAAGIITWLLPSIVLVPFIVYWNRRLSKRNINTISHNTFS